MVNLECGGLLGVRQGRCPALPRLGSWSRTRGVHGVHGVHAVSCGSRRRDQRCELGRVRVRPLGPGQGQGVWSSRRQRREGVDLARGSRNVKYRIHAVASAYPPIAQTEKTFRLPIDYYQVLGAETHNLADAIVRAFEARVNNPPREGFSQQALLARLEILRGARDTLANPEIRADYNQGLIEDEAGTLILDVPWTKVGGALCLLHEVGEVEVVLQAGQALLGQQQDLPKTLNRDVVLAMSLSYVELSREAMAETPPAVVKSCSLLESALKLLQEEGGSGLAPDLQDQIEGTLEELAARCVLELLALPLDKEHEAQRQQGLQGLRSLLWTVDEAGHGAPLGGFTREQFMKEAFSLLTAAEQVDLFTATPSNIPADSSEVYAVALANVAEGFVAKKPQAIQEADALFLQLQQANASLTDHDPSAAPVDFALERGLCALLLGEVDHCRTWLGLEAEDSPLRDPSVVSFIYSHSEEGEEGDSLPGLCKLLEGWLTEMVFPRFRDTESLHAVLRDYFDDPSVLNYLEGLEKGGGSPMAAAAAIVRIGAGAGAALNNVKATLKRVFPLGRTKESSATSAVLETPIELPRRDLSQFVSHKGTDGEALGPGSAGGSTSFGGENWEGSEEEQDDSRERKLTASPSSGGGLGPLQIAGTGIVFGALVMAGLRYLPMHPRFTHLLNSGTPSVSTSGVREEKAVREEFPKMDARLAELTVRQWQTAKARALGSTHDVAQLPEVLDGEMLRSWTDRVNDVVRNGWFWEYTLVGLTIDSVTVSDDGRRATVEATLQEAARLIDSRNPEHEDSYRSTYTTRYDLRCSSGGWRISNGAVLRT